MNEFLGSLKLWTAHCIKSRHLGPCVSFFFLTVAPPRVLSFNEWPEISWQLIDLALMYFHFQFDRWPLLL